MSKKPVKKGIITAVIAVIVIAAVSLAWALLSGRDHAGEDTTAPSSSQSETQTTAQPEPEQVVFEDDRMKVVFKKVYDEAVIRGLCYFAVNVENKTDTTVTLVFSDAYANDQPITVLSGDPTKIPPKEKADSAHCFTCAQAGITDSADVKQMQLCISAVDDNGKEIANSGPILIHTK